MSASFCVVGGLVGNRPGRRAALIDLLFYLVFEQGSFFAVSGRAPWAVEDGEALIGIFG
jgi:hypothetical protein